MVMTFFVIFHLCRAARRGSKWVLTSHSTSESTSAPAGRWPQTSGSLDERSNQTDRSRLRNRVAERNAQWRRLSRATGPSGQRCDGRKKEAETMTKIELHNHGGTATAVAFSPVVSPVAGQFIAGMAPIGTAAPSPGVHMGMGASCQVAPRATGRLRVEFTGSFTAASVMSGNVQIRYGLVRGGVPANTNTPNGTAVGNVIVSTVAGAGFSEAFAVKAQIPGLTKGATIGSILCCSPVRVQQSGLPVCSSTRSNFRACTHKSSIVRGGDVRSALKSRHRRRLSERQLRARIGH